MSTKTMRLPPRRILTSNDNNNNNAKRKEREGFDSLKPTPQQSAVPPAKLTKLISTPQVIGSAKLSEPASAPLSSSSQLLAGYMAHEFLAKGTLFGQPWDADRAERSSFSGSESDKRSQEGKEAEGNHRYVEVSCLLRGEEGGHIPGILNPSQLARFLQL